MSTPMMNGDKPSSLGSLLPAKTAVTTGTLQEIIGSGWAFPPKIDAQGGMAMTSERNELVQSIFIILSTAPGQRVMRPTFGCRLHERQPRRAAMWRRRWGCGSPGLMS
jgi:hypothetical protein